MALFGKALSNMMVWYAHPNTMTFKLTGLPDGYPNGFKFPEGMKPNMADYEDRYHLALPASLTLPSTHTRCGLCSGVGAFASHQ